MDKKFLDKLSELYAFVRNYRFTLLTSFACSILLVNSLYPFISSLSGVRA